MFWLWSLKLFKKHFFIIPVLNVHNNGPKFVISVQEVLTQWETISYTNRVSQDDMMYEAGPARRACPGRPTPSHRCRWVSPSGSCSPSASLQGRGSNQRIRIYSQPTQNPAVSGVITNILLVVVSNLQYSELFIQVHLFVSRLSLTLTSEAY